jgi:hypothetical protein
MNSLLPKPPICLVYQFRVIPTQVPSFQDWAEKRGMGFWQQQPGVLRYKTFRKLLPAAETGQSLDLAGQDAGIDVLSQVELLDLACLERITAQPDFQQIQSELLTFVYPGSLDYSLLDYAYDSGPESC